MRPLNGTATLPGPRAARRKTDGVTLTLHARPVLAPATQRAPLRRPATLPVVEKISVERSSTESDRTVPAGVLGFFGRAASCAVSAVPTVKRAFVLLKAVTIGGVRSVVPGAPPPS